MDITHNKRRPARGVPATFPPTMTEIQARVFWEWLMCSDPWPLDDSKHAAMESFANELAHRFGYRNDIGAGDWIAAFHDVPPSPYPKGWA